MPLTCPPAIIPASATRGAFQARRSWSSQTPGQREWPQHMITDLRSLVAPNPLATLSDAIVAEHRLHLHTTQQADFARLLPWPAFNALVTLDGLQGGQVRAIRNGHDMPIGMLTARSDGSTIRNWRQTRCSHWLIWASAWSSTISTS